MSEREPAYYAVIPANVRYDKTLSPNAKLLYGELTALSHKAGYCWASNEYFAELYNVHRKTVSQWISELNAKHYIRVEVVDDAAKGKARKIYIADAPPVSAESKDGEGIHEKTHTPSPQKDGQGIREIMEGTPRKDGEGIREKTAYNITVNNTGNNTTTTTNATPAGAEGPTNGGSGGADQEVMKSLDEMSWFLRAHWGKKAPSGYKVIRALQEIAKRVGLAEMSECIKITSKAPEDKISVRYLEGTIERRAADRMKAAQAEASKLTNGRVDIDCETCATHMAVPVADLAKHRGGSFSCPECGTKYSVDKYLPSLNERSDV